MVVVDLFRDRSSRGFSTHGLRAVSLRLSGVGALPYQNKRSPVGPDPRTTFTRPVETPRPRLVTGLRRSGYTSGNYCVQEWTGRGVGVWVRHLRPTVPGRGTGQGGSLWSWTPWGSRGKGDVDIVEDGVGTGGRSRGRDPRGSPPSDTFMDKSFPQTSRDTQSVTRDPRDRGGSRPTHTPRLRAPNKGQNGKRWGVPYYL